MSVETVDKKYHLPVITTSAEDDGMACLETTEYLTHQLREGNDDPYPDLRESLSRKGFSYLDICVVWIVPLSEYSDRFVVATRDLRLFTFDFRSGEINQWQEVAEILHSDYAEYYHAGNEYFSKHDS